MSIKSLNKSVTQTHIPFNINDPQYNYVKVYRCLVLIEDHLSDSQSRCRKCVHKHLQTAVALLEEAHQLDTHYKYAGENEVMQHVLKPCLQKVLQFNTGSVMSRAMDDVLQTSRKVRKYIGDTILWTPQTS